MHAAAKNIRQLMAVLKLPVEENFLNLVINLTLPVIN
jgi:hypothetical protein